MDFAIIYIFNRAFYRLGAFFHNWYIRGTRSILHRFISTLESLDRFFAIRITLRFLFQPLYKDYTIVGRMLGFIFRSGRVLMGLAVYLLISGIFIFIYAAWLLTPPLLLIYAARNSA